MELIIANVVPNMLCHPTCAGPFAKGGDYRDGAVVVGQAAQRGQFGGVDKVGGEY